MEECSDSDSRASSRSSQRRLLPTVGAAALALGSIKVWLAARLDLFGDEAFYFWESRHLAAGYTDVPPLLPWLLRLGGELAGSGTLGVRWIGLALGSLLLPGLVYAWARRSTDRTAALQTVGLSFCIPLAALLGVLALPDVPLTCVMLGALIALDRASATDRWRDWLLLGCCLALGWLTHYRFVMLYVAGAAFILGTVRGRSQLRRPGFWTAHAIGAIGLAPILWFNYFSGWAALRFQFLERHPWTFHADALVEPLVQSVVTTPLLFLLLLWAMLRAMRSRRGAEDLLASASLGLLLGYLVLDCFADSTRVRFHWPLPAYLIALPALPGLLCELRARGGWRALVARAAPVLGALGTLAGIAWMANAARPPEALEGFAARWVPDNIVGWSRVAAFAESERAAIGDEAVAIADNFLLGAEWAFARWPAQAPFVLDHPLNAKHGRAGQLGLWAVDETGLARSHWTRGLLLVEETARRPLDVLPAYQALCARFASVEYRRELILRDGRARFVSFSVTPGRDAAANDACALPPMAYIDSPAPEAVVRGETVGVQGWAIAEYLGVAAVELLVDGQANGHVVYGIPAAKVLAQWPQSRDPHHPRVGLAGMLDLSVLAPGRHRLSVRVTDSRGHARETAQQWLTVAR